MIYRPNQNLYIASYVSETETPFKRGIIISRPDNTGEIILTMEEAEAAAHAVLGCKIEHNLKNRNADTNTELPRSQQAISLNS